MSTIATDLRFDAETHTYWHGLEQYQSVTSVVRMMLPVKKSWAGVDSRIIENARERGILIDRYCCELARTGRVETAADERLDVIAGVRAFTEWWREQEWWREGGAVVETQKILADPINGIAGTADLVIPGCIYDIKCTSAIEADVAYQLGAYAYMQSTSHLHISADGPSVAVIHINKKYPSGLKVIPLDALDCIYKWRNLLAFYRDVKPLLKSEPSES
jgi:hypothetical protein